MTNKEFRFKDYNVFSAEGRKVLEKMPLKWARVQFSDRVLLVRVQLWRKGSFRRLYFNTRPIDNPQWEKKGNTMGYISLLPDEYDYDGSFHELIHALNTILDSAK